MEQPLWAGKGFRTVKQGEASQLFFRMAWPGSLAFPRPTWCSKCSVPSVGSSKQKAVTCRTISRWLDTTVGSYQIWERCAFHHNAVASLGVLTGLDRQFVAFLPKTADRSYAQQPCDSSQPGPGTFLSL